MNTTAKINKTKKSKSVLSARLANNWQLYAMLLVPIVLTFVYKYLPMYGLQIAFRDYSEAKGIANSDFVAFKWFERLFRAPNAVRMIKNTFLISLYGLIASFPVPIIISLALNQLKNKSLKKWTQTVIYAPHFISVMVIAGMIHVFLSPNGGLFNLLLGTEIDYINQPELFRTIYILSGIWQEAGWGTIIYLATLSSIDESLYEAAKIDGASLWQRIWNIDIPHLIPIIMLSLIMSVSSLMNVGFEKAYLLQTNLNKPTSDIIAVHIYEQGIQRTKYSYSAAVGLFNSGINLILLFIVNRVVKKYSEISFV